MNHYDILNIPIDADDAMIRSAFRKLARQYHPDAGSGSSSEKFREAIDAYETLSDPGRRTDYDKHFLKPSARVPVCVEQMQQSRSMWTVLPGNPRLRVESLSELDRLMFSLFRCLEDDFFSSWPFSR